MTLMFNALVALAIGMVYAQVLIWADEKWKFMDAFFWMMIILGGTSIGFLCGWYKVGGMIVAWLAK